MLLHFGLSNSKLFKIDILNIFHSISQCAENARQNIHLTDFSGLWNKRSGITLHDRHFSKSAVCTKLLTLSTHRVMWTVGLKKSNGAWQSIYGVTKTLSASNKIVIRIFKCCRRSKAVHCTRILALNLTKMSLVNICSDYLELKAVLPCNLSPFHARLSHSALWGGQFCKL